MFLSARICVALTIILILLENVAQAINVRTQNGFRVKQKTPLHTKKLNSTNTYAYSTLYFNTRLDHFSFTRESETFPLRYLKQTTHWKSGGPILFYTGNEGDIELFAQNTGFVWELAPQLSGMVIFAEHRYYGKSLPFGKSSYSNVSHFGYLTAEQALADYVELIQHLKSTIDGAAASPVILFGGSYGGMLSAWMRIKYPNIVAGALAASAPVWMFPGMMSDVNAMSRVQTQAYARLGTQNCPDNIRNIWPIIRTLANSPSGRQALARTFQLCSVDSARELYAFINEYLFSIAMANYPYPAGFLGKWPAWPVQQLCKPLSAGKITNGATLLMKFRQGFVDNVLNYTRNLKCLDVQSSSPGLDDNGWNVQSCVEMVMPTGSNGKTDMFEPVKFDLKTVSDECARNFGVRPRMHWMEHQFWAKKIETASNIFFSNGDLDPWSAGGVLKTVNPNLPTRIIKMGAHHLDLRASDPADTKDVRDARREELKWIQKWIRNWK